MARTGTVTVGFTDLVGYGGTGVKTTGDGLMLRFDSAASAVRLGPGGRAGLLAIRGTSR